MLRCADCKSTTRKLYWWSKTIGACETCIRSRERGRNTAAHASRVAKVYGLAPGAYVALLKRQGGTCAIKGCRANGRTKRLAVDHDHRTGIIRGLLCGPHNRLIGQFNDDPDLLQSFADYIRNPPSYDVPEMEL